jgi:hypothetical protein
MLQLTVSRPVCLRVKLPSGAYDQFLLLSDRAGLLVWDALSDERTSLPFTIAAGSHQRSFTLSDSKLPQPGGPGLCVYIPREQGGPVLHSGTGFCFRRLLLLVGLLCEYSIPPPRGVLISLATDLLYRRGKDLIENTLY